ncbi:MAG TPA: response regulator, partial [Burkholderiales bacterium]
MSANDRPVILCVDDATDLLALMGRALGEDYRVITVANGADAIAAALAEPRPDLILLDIDMPGVSGLQVCRALKGEVRTADIPVVFLTARNGMQAQVEGFEAGAVDYITKPFNAF